MFPYSLGYHFAPFIALPFFGIFLIVLLIWSLFWKGLALWFAARAEQKWWYLVMLIVNTGGLLEIIYLVWFRPRPQPTLFDSTNNKPADGTSSAEPT